MNQLLLAFSILAASARPSVADAPEVRVQFTQETRAAAAYGRLLVIFAPVGGDEASEPRFRVHGNIGSAQVLGLDVEGFEPGESATIGADVFGYPAASLAEVPAGEYTVQAVLHLYETFEVAHGHTLKLPMDRGEGQHGIELRAT